MVHGSTSLDVRCDYYRIEDRYSDVLPVSNILWIRTRNLVSCINECHIAADCASIFYGNGLCYGYVRKLHDEVSTTVSIGIKYYEIAGPVGNLAAGKPTTQSSSLDNAAFGPQYAVDSRRYPIQNAPESLRSCSHTEVGGRGDDTPFWEVDLLSRHKITSLSFLSRNECCGERNTGLNITVAETSGGPYVLCSYYPLGTGFVGEMKTFYCIQPLTGRFVRMSRDLPVINACEIEIYGNKLN
ncbi:fucolectin-1-like [Mizuhopecten yessoensis]|uniref:fucolectin-1-like n=1 Tax=Mizuhopecten yessoensis TaxID=6573 RepID=UPI000B45A55E|nr:fucolectin-1-like [Mizuhopecten yessoensis]